MDSEAFHLSAIVKVIADQAALATQGQGDQPMMGLAGLLTADQVALVIQDQVAPLMMVPVAQHIADRAARVMQDQVDHAIQAPAEVGGHARPFVAKSKGMALSSAMLSLI